MAFQDFDQISERRRIERQRKFRKRIIIGALSAILIVAVAAVAVVVVTKTSAKQNQNRPNTQPSPANQVSHAEAIIKTICKSADYEEKCQSVLKSAAGPGSNLSQPRDFVKAAINATSVELTKAFDKASAFTFSSPEEKGAFEDCQQLFADAKDELGESISQIIKSNAGNLGSKAHDLNNWLSAVMSYVETCIDGFPEGKTKSNMQQAFNDTKQFTSNSLAIVNGISSFPSSSKGPSRLLLSDGLPSWMNHEERRMLRGNKDDKPTPNVVVAKDDSGQFKTITEALAAMPSKYEGRYVIYVKEGTYDETVVVTKKMENVTMYGDGSQKSIITGNKNFVDGVRTFQTASFAVMGKGFMAKAMGFRNTAGPEKHQAVAARVQADRSIFLNCRFEGYQDTLYVQTHKQFYRSCVVSGTVDFIFGDAAAIFQNCLIFVRKPLDNQQNIVTAQGRTDRREETGIVLQNCKIQPDPELVPVKTQIKSYLGRPWKEFSRTIVMESTIEDFISPEGWLPWAGDFALKTLTYAEYNNKGPGAALADRVKWPGYKGAIKKQEAKKFTVQPFLQGSWINAAGVPVHFGLFS